MKKIKSFALNIRNKKKHSIVTNINFVKALFLPKLQSYFAEFLQYCYPKRLSILYPTTCVSLQYG